MKPARQIKVFLLVLILLFGACISACTPSATGSSELMYGLTLTPSGLDPHLNASSELGIPLSSVYDTLIFQVQDSGEFVPGLAKRWTISEDGLDYTFYLREDVLFHDGTLFDANAVAANLDYIVDPDHRSQKARYMLGPYMGYTIVDSHTIVIQLSEPFTPLLDALSQVYLGMASPLALETWGPVEYQFHQVGTGPYRFVEYIPADHITLQRNPDYAWAPSVYDAETASIETIIFRFFTDSATRAFALETGQVDILGEIPPSEAMRLDSLEQFNLYSIAIPGIPMQFIFNSTLAPTDNASIREALIMALNREAIVNTIFMGTSPVAEGPLTSELLPLDSRTTFPAFQREDAIIALQNAGWEQSSQDASFTIDGSTATLKIVVPPWGSAPEVAQLIAAAWQDLGLMVEIELVPGFGGLLEAQQRGNYHLIALNEFGSDPNFITPYYDSDGAFNWSGIASETMDRLLETASQSMFNREARSDLYRQIAVLVRDEALIIPIREYVNLVIANTRVDGLHFSPQGWFPYLIDVHLNS